MKKAYRAFCFKGVYHWKISGNLPISCMYNKKYFLYSICKLHVYLRNLSIRYMQAAYMSPKPFGKVYANCMYDKKYFRQGICKLHIYLRNISIRYMQTAYISPKLFDKIYANCIYISEYFQQGSHEW